MLGDMNGDGLVNTADIRPFVLALTDRRQYEIAYDLDADVAGDMDGDGRLTGNDIRLFASALTGDLADPATPYNYKRFSGPAFVGGASFDDVAQGAVGDCYFLAVLASLAVTDPEIVESMVAPLGDGTYRVRFYDRAGQEVFVRVDGDLPVRYDGSLVYAGSELGIALAEKAYAKFQGHDSYAELAGGNPSEAYRTVAGGYTITRWTNRPAAELFECLEKNLAAGHAITLRSNHDATIVRQLHAYAVTSTARPETVEIYDVKGQGSLYLTIDQVKAEFSSFVISSV